MFYESEPVATPDTRTAAPGGQEQPHLEMCHLGTPIRTFIPQDEANQSVPERADQPGAPVTAQERP